MMSCTRLWSCSRADEGSVTTLILAEKALYVHSGSPPLPRQRVSRFSRLPYTACVGVSVQ